MSTTLTWLATYVVAAVILGGAVFAIPQLKQLPFGMDNRASTSKVQFWAWMVVVVFALLALLAAWVLDQVGATDAPVGDAFDVFTEEGLDETYLLLLGLPAGAAIGAKVITTTKVDNGSVEKSEKPEGEAGSPVKELVSDDEGNGDLGDAQYVLFNLVALIYFLAQFLLYPDNGLPDMPDTLVGLTGVAAGAYVSKKAVYREPPVLFAAHPPAQAPGGKITIYGERLESEKAETAESHRSMIVFGTRPVPADAGSKPEQLEVTVPPDLEPGPVKLHVMRPPGALSDKIDFHVIDARPVVSAVRPPRIVLGTDARLAVSGHGFLASGAATGLQPAVLIDGREMPTPAGPTDTLLTIALPVDDAGIKAMQLDSGEYDLVVHDPLGHASEPTRVTIVATMRPQQETEVVPG